MIDCQEWQPEDASVCWRMELWLCRVMLSTNCFAHRPLNSGNLIHFCFHISFSQMVSSPANRQTFINSVISFLRQYEFDGLDIDWEYPANRGGPPEDQQNYSVFLEVCLVFSGD